MNFLHIVSLKIFLEECIFKSHPLVKKKFIVCSGSIKTYLINITKKHFGKAYIYKLNRSDALFVP